MLFNVRFFCSPDSHVHLIVRANNWSDAIAAAMEHLSGSGVDLNAIKLDGVDKLGENHGVLAVIWK